MADSGWAGIGTKTAQQVGLLASQAKDRIEAEAVAGEDVCERAYAEGVLAALTWLENTFGPYPFDIYGEGRG